MNTQAGFDMWAILAHIAPVVFLFLALRRIVGRAAIAVLLFIGLGLFVEMFPNDRAAAGLWHLVAPWGITLFLLWLFWLMAFGPKRAAKSRDRER